MPHYMQPIYAGAHSEKNHPSVVSSSKKAKTKTKSNSNNKKNTSDKTTEVRNIEL